MNDENINIEETKKMEKKIRKKKIITLCVIGTLIVIISIILIIINIQTKSNNKELKQKQDSKIDIPGSDVKDDIVKDDKTHIYFYLNKLYNGKLSDNVKITKNSFEVTDYLLADYTCNSDDCVGYDSDYMYGAVIYDNNKYIYYSFLFEL